MVLPNFAGQALRGDPIRVFGTGEQSRCFGHVRETVEAILRLLEAPAAIGEVVNLGSDHEVTINRLAEMVRNVVGSSSEIVHVPYDEAYAEGFEDLERRVPDLRKLERLTGFRFSAPLEQIIQDVVDDQRRRLGVEARPPRLHRAARGAVSPARVRGNRRSAPARG
jgi:UDP-glucose 4-epimerase